MKKLMRNLMMVSIVTCATQLANAQAWGRHTNVLSVGVGPSQFIHLDRYYYTDAPVPGLYYWPVTGQFNFQGEFGIHKYVGLGFTTGIGGRGPVSRNYLGELNIPVGLIANFHFYQLIADNASRNIHADKLDIYAGVNAGSGVAFTYYNDAVRAVPLAFGGLQAGIRYYFVPRVAINGELGFGKSIVNVGFTFKL
jgi:hypothetical protein